MDTTTYEQAREILGDARLHDLGAQIDDSVPTGRVEQRAPGRPTVTMSLASFVGASQRSMRGHADGRVAPTLARWRADKKRARQNRVRARR